jgi:guanylate kinase
MAQVPENKHQAARPSTRGGLLLIVSGPAGSGKTTVCNRLAKKYPHSVERVITSTTRAPRDGERHGVDYFFFSDEEFDQLLRDNQFYEHAKVHTHRYGTLKRAIIDKLESAIDLILSIDVQGAASVRKATARDANLAPRMRTVFIVPADLDQLRQRLTGRGLDSGEEIERRLRTAERELEMRDAFDYQFVSGDKEDDFRNLCEIYERERSRLNRG